MNIAVTANGESLDSQVSEQFETCSYILIVNMDDLTVTPISRNENSGTSPDEKLARIVLDYNCEAVITGNIYQTAFDILTDAFVTRYYGAGHSVREALELSENQKLQLIKEDCNSSHSHIH